MNRQNSEDDSRPNQAESVDSSKTRQRKMIIAVHGIGDQFNNATVQTVAYRFCDFFEVPKGVPLGSFYAKTVGSQHTSLFQNKFYPEPLRHFDFAEAYWAEVPREPAKEGHTIEESKKWARTIVERLHLHRKNCLAELDNAEPQKDKKSPGLKEKDYEKIKFVLEEMINTLMVLERLCFLAEKAGVFKFDLQKLFVDYLSDVQIVTEFKDFREDILAQFFAVMKTIKPECSEIYIIAHSEGTVVSFLGLLRAICNHKSKDDEWAWVEKVRGYMTIGSPIDKHLIFWPELWDEFKAPPPTQPPQASATPAQTSSAKHGEVPHDQPANCAESRVPAYQIQWFNYYDYGDPIGFELETARQFLCDNGLNDAFVFDADHDLGFHRYLFPGKAHTDYWEDTELFNHFIETVVREEKPKEKKTKRRQQATDFAKRPNRFWPQLLTLTIPYLLSVILLYVAIYVIYKAAAEAGPSPLESTHDIFLNVLGLTSLMAGITLMARLPRLAPPLSGLLYGTVAFTVLAVFYCLLISRLESLIPRRGSEYWFAEFPKFIIVGLGRWLNIDLLAYLDPLLTFAVLITITVYVLNYVFPKWGLYTVLAPGAVSVLGMVIFRLQFHKQGGSLWPVMLAMGGFLYLWWLAALLFDLVFVWRAYIRNSLAVDQLRQITGRKTVAERKKRQQADSLSLPAAKAKSA